MPTTTRRARLRIAVICAAVVLAAGAGALAITHFGASAPPVTTAGNDVAGDGSIDVIAGLDNCGSGWSSSTGGPLTFVVNNTSIGNIDVYLQSADTGAVYGELEGLGSRASATLSAVLGDGSYEFVCIGADAPVTTGAQVSIANSAARSDLTPGVVPVTRNDLYQPTQQYSAWITAQLPVLAGGVADLATSIQSGDRAAARRSWIAAHVTYETLGAAYGAFGNSDTAINGTPGAGMTAETDPDLTGFHRIESILWSDQQLSAAAPFAAQLVSDVSTLETTFATTRLDPQDVGLRAHEILENSVQEELNGSDDAGSGSTFATIDANIEGTEQAVLPLRPLLADRGFDLATLDDWLARSTALVESFRGPDGSWTPLSSITAAQREQVNATLSETVELLAPIAAICDIRQGV
ncbi:imelysin family protein [Subtercola lobariae]|uniref:Iron transporter n=1 Tax=Subtercola lobariae TaxID=1588641 RepID=A0A917BC67_9MICO|nr:imelysin family protein [Subtercola lobariae]GGF36663.1 iron transporter [Subtercola lobariae]